MHVQLAYSCPPQEKQQLQQQQHQLYHQQQHLHQSQQHQQQQQQQQQLPSRYRVGYWWSEKKSQKLSATELTNLFAERDCQLVKIDLDRPIEEQGPFSLIVHKVSDLLVKADQGDLVAKKTISAFESYVRKHPETVIMDPLDNNRALLDRYKQYRLIEQSDLAKEGVVFTPPFVHLTSTNIDVNRGRIRRSKITFPIVCKPILAQGSTGAHQMCIIFSEAGLKDVKPPCVAQSFVNHNAKLFKLFVIKDKYYIMERPSLKNFQAGDYETVFFYSHDISKPNSSSSLTELDESDKLKLEEMMSKMRINTEQMQQTDLMIRCSNNNNKTSASNINNNNDNLSSRGCPRQIVPIDTTYTSCLDKKITTTTTITPQAATTETPTKIPKLEHCTNERTSQEAQSNIMCPLLMPSNARLNKIVQIFSEKLGLTFYGIDIIIENGTSRYAIIDMNTFPGYDGVENFLTIFRDVVCDAIPKDIDETQSEHLCRMRVNRRNPTEIDSGIEST